MRNLFCGLCGQALEEDICLRCYPPETPQPVPVTLPPASDGSVRNEREAAQHMRRWLSESKRRVENGE